MGAFVQPAFYEAFGLTVVEAMTCGSPTFPTINGGRAEIIVHRKSGFHIDTYNGEQLSGHKGVMEAAGSKQERDWAELLQEILECIASRVCLADHRVFGLVCSPWRRASTSKLAKPRCCRFPWLMLPKCKSMETRVFYCHEHQRILQHPLPTEVLKSWCSGASHGWFIMARKTKNGGGDFMFNPFSGARVSLPPHRPILDDRDDERPHLHPYYISKAILSSDDGIADHQGSNCLIAAIYESLSRSHIGICRPGDQDWTWTEALVDHGIIWGQNHGGHGEDDGINDNEFVGGEGDDANNGVEDGDQSDDDDSVSEDDEDESTDDEDESTDDEDNEGEEEGGGGEEEREEGEVVMVGEEEPVNDNEQRLGIIDGWCLTGVCDIIFHKGNIYAIAGEGELYVCDIIGDRISWRRVQTQPFKLKLNNSIYFVHLVESRGELLMVVRLISEIYPMGFRTNRFIVFRMIADHESRSDQLPKWVRVESLGDQALFLGQNHSQSISVSDSLNFLENCIYYADQDQPVHVALNSAVNEVATRLKHLDLGDSQATIRRNEIGISSD
ncbi:hypothetical protein RJ640_019761 [Escallonia rubra]|uniref:DUF295 domain-containing protein n=1 Tax=Escallonia rubra TaxID=112253 RepID=A0AA88QTY7_9ASTE|nr:hypothetical protein RJ640_019761 [Escallonia rubra]